LVACGPTNDYDRTVRKADITVEVVACLVRSQFPQWSELEIRPVELDGWDNTTFRLGEDMSVRLPSDKMYVAQIDKEHRWLPVLAPKLPLPRIRSPRARLDAVFPHRGRSIGGWTASPPVLPA